MNPKVAPIRNKSLDKKINDIPTQFSCTEYSDYIFLVCTQYGKIGTLVSVKPVPKKDGSASPFNITKVMMGEDDPQAVETAKAMATFAMTEAGRRSVMLGLSLKDTAAESIEQMKVHIKSLLVWLLRK